MLTGFWTLFAADCAQLIALARRARVPANAGGWTIFGGGDAAASPQAGIASLLRAAKRDNRFEAYLTPPATAETETGATTHGSASSSGDGSGGGAERVAAAAAAASTSTASASSSSAAVAVLAHAHARAAYYLFLLAMVRGRDPLRGVLSGRVGAALRVASVHANPIELLAEACDVDLAAPLARTHAIVVAEAVSSMQAHAEYVHVSELRVLFSAYYVVSIVGLIVLAMACGCACILVSSCAARVAWVGVVARQCALWTPDCACFDPTLVWIACCTVCWLV